MRQIVYSKWQHYKTEDEDSKTEEAVSDAASNEDKTSQTLGKNGRGKRNSKKTGVKRNVHAVVLLLLQLLLLEVKEVVVIAAEVEAVVAAVAAAVAVAVVVVMVMVELRVKTVMVLQ